jgi:crotonobetainyl-CoA:carnitine CoA-transferase CaiB-like acyl-CoA transferase
MIDLMHARKKLLERAANIRANSEARSGESGFSTSAPSSQARIAPRSSVSSAPRSSRSSRQSWAIPSRRLGTDTECGDTLVWLSESLQEMRHTRPQTERGRGLLRKLAAECDVVVENFRPGTLEKWGLGYEDLKKLNPRTILVRISAYGQDGPLRSQPGFARIAHAFSGLTYLSGEPGQVPVVPGSTSLADYMSGMNGAIGALVALRARDVSGEGQCVDLALYESVFRVLDEIAPAYQKFGYVRERMGADTVNVCPHSHYGTSDGKWIAIACSNDQMFARLADAMGHPELASSERLVSGEPRLAAREEVNRIVADWTASHDHRTILAICKKFDVPASLITASRIFSRIRSIAREAISAPQPPGSETLPCLKSCRGSRRRRARSAGSARHWERRTPRCSKGSWD